MAGHIERKEIMARYNVLYNPHAGNGWNDEKKNIVEKATKGAELKFFDMTKADYASLWSGEIGPDENILIIGGDGTLNRFVNDTEKLDIRNPIYILAGGTGNDFLADLGADTDKPLQINQYIEKLPVVTVNGKDYKFINGVGYGIDGYCCEVGDEMRKKSSAPVNYTAIAIKGLLFKFRPRNAVVTVDGVRRTYKNVWLAPTMNGRCYGGGMIPTPAQDRLNKDRSLSILVWHSGSSIATLMNFPAIFKGEHLKKAKMCEVLTGHDITVEFDRPTALQIDGETVLGVTKYEAKSYKLCEAQLTAAK